MADEVKIALRQNLSSALERGDLRQATLLLQQLQQDDPLGRETRGLELDLLLHSGRLREARALAEQLVQLFPESPRIQYLAGQVAYGAKNYAQAAEQFRESHRLRQHWRSALALAKTLTQLGILDEAATILETLLPEHSECYRDLAWLHERRGNNDRALTAIEAYLRDRPHNKWAQAQRVRLRARAMRPEQLVRDIQELLEFGEQVAESVVPEYLEALFRTGQAGAVRQFVGERRTGLSPPAAVGAAWICYRFQAYDLALDLFMAAFSANLGNVKFLAAVEYAATRCERLPELMHLYERYTLEDRRLYGRLQKLRRRAQQVSQGNS